MLDDKALRIGLLFFLALVSAELVSLLILNSGHFVYTLDDAYIHMALADQIARGHYGINPQEFSAPSSSILWPLLLAPFMRTPLAGIAPFLLNLIAASLTLRVLSSILKQAFPGGTETRQPRFVTLVLFLAVPATNLVGLVFLGMEHSLQLLAAMMLLNGILKEADGGKPDLALGAAIVLGPLIRYENAALSAAAILYLLARGHRKTPMASAAAILASVGGFSLFLRLLGQAALPTSVMVKTDLVSVGGRFASLTARLGKNLSDPMGMLMALGMAALLGFALFSKARKQDRLWAAAAAMAAAMHLTAGQFGWFNRLEISACVFQGFTLLYLSRHWIADRLAKHAFLPVSASTALVLLLLGHPYVTGLFLIPLGSNNIYEQHFQMHRFAVEFYKQPVAVMDLGYVAYRNPNFVLDLGGLANREVSRYLQTSENREWMDLMAAKYSIGLAMIYDDSIMAAPASWKKVGELRLGKPRITPFMSTVSFYALNQASFEQIQELIPPFRASLPKGVAFN